MPNKIKNKFTFPRATEFTPRDLVIDVKAGHLYYKSNFAVFRVNATVFSTNVDSSLSTDATIGIAQDTEVLFNNSTTIDGIGNFTVTAATDGSGNGTVNIGNVNIDGGSIDGTTIGANSTAGGSFGDLSSNTHTVSGLTANKIIFTGTGGVLKTDSQFGFNDSTNVLTVPTATMEVLTMGNGSIQKNITSANGKNLFLTTENNTYNAQTGGGGIVVKKYSSASSAFVNIKGGLYISNMGNNPGDLKVVQDIVAFASDKRLKENIVNIENPLQKIKQLRGVYFDWKNITKKLGFAPPTMKNEIGMIAQEVEQIIPQAIEPAPFNEEYKTIKYDRLIPLLVECINEQQKQIDNLTNQVKQCQK